MERTEVVIERDKELTEDDIERILELDVKTILVKVEDHDGIDYSVIYNTLKKDTSNNSKEAVEYIYRQLRNAEPPDEETARLVEQLYSARAVKASQMPLDPCPLGPPAVVSPGAR